MPVSGPPDRLYHHARREAIVTLVVWAVAMFWTVGYCYLRGYQHAPDSWVVQVGLASDRTPTNFQQIAGLPDWVVYGIVLPWVACSLFTAYFSLFRMKDDDLGQEGGEDA